MIAIIKEPDKIRRAVRMKQQDGMSVALVPTMGAIHEGHLSLVRRACNKADYIVVSVFINPFQFNDIGDYERYPQDVKRDRMLLEEAGADCIFAPDKENMYPHGYATYVTVEGLTEGLCGASRPGHFRGVATVVAKLFNAVAPDYAVFGEKDYQQLAVIRRMVIDLNIPVEIVSAPIVREPDGLAMSSRNVLLNPHDRQAATVLFRALKAAEEMVGEMIVNADEIAGRVRAMIDSNGSAVVDYVSLVDAATLEPVTEVEKDTLLALAVSFGGVRLIDNIILSRRRV